MKKLIIIFFVVFISVSVDSQVIITRNDSLIDFIYGDWVLTKSYNTVDSIKEKIPNIGSSKKIHFERLNGRNDSITCTIFQPDSMYRIVHYKVNYIVPNWSSNPFRKEWILKSKSKNGLPNLEMSLKIKDRDSILLIEVCYKGCKSEFTRKMNN